MLAELHKRVRSLLKTPSFTLLSIGILTLGIGGAVAVFSVVNAVLLTELSFAEPERLVRIWEERRTPGEEPEQLSVAYPNFIDWREESDSLHGMVITDPDRDYNLTGGEQPIRVVAAWVNVEFFGVLGVEPTSGRDFTREEGEIGNHRVVILSDGLWSRQYGRDPDVINDTIQLSGRDHVVVGVMPEGFRFPSPSVDLWLPMPIAPEQMGRWARAFDAYARLAPGVGLGQAQQEVDAVAARLEEQFPEPNADMRVRLVPLKEQLVSGTADLLWLILGAVGLVLLIAVVNVANLFLLRSLGQLKEVALRTALGAGGASIWRQFLIDGLLVSLVGGGLGLLIATWLSGVFVAYGPQDLPRMQEVEVDGRVILMAVGVSIVAGLLLGTISSLVARRRHLASVLQESGRGSEGRERRLLREGLVVAEVALAVVLLTGAGLLMASFVRLFQVEPGFEVEGVLTSRVDLPRFSYREEEQAISFFQETLERLSSLPDIESAGMVNELPLTHRNTVWTYYAEGEVVPEAGQSPEAGLRIVGGDYFRTLEIPLLRGRTFRGVAEPSDPGSALVNQTMAEKTWEGENPIGKRLKLGNASSELPWMTVVGVVADVHHTSLVEAPIAEIYVPYSPRWTTDMSFVVRANGDPRSLEPIVRREIRALDADLPVYANSLVQDLLADSLTEQRLSLLAFSSFAALALLLAVVGIYGIMAHTVFQQRQRISIQMALGAGRRRVLSAVLTRGAILAGLGVLAGLGLTGLIWPRLQKFLYEPTGTDLLIPVVVAVLFLLVSVLACVPSASRATRVSPATCLKESA